MWPLPFRSHIICRIPGPAPVSSPSCRELQHQHQQQAGARPWIPQGHEIKMSLLWRLCDADNTASFAVQPSCSAARRHACKALAHLLALLFALETIPQDATRLAPASSSSAVFSQSLSPSVPPYL